jgi:hypothetical protein
MTPKARARESIDQKLAASSWVVPQVSNAEPASVLL